MREPAITHKIMSSIPSKDTKPELALRKELWRKGYRYRVNVKKLPGKPDIVFGPARVVVFCDGDFWHGHNWALRGIPSLEEELAGYSQFWKEKITRNIDRDKRVTAELESLGWIVIRIWESDVKSDLPACIMKIETVISKQLTKQKDKVD